MSNKLVVSAVRIIHSLNKDIAGNLLSGQDVRVAQYVKIQAAVSEALVQKLNSGGDFKAEQNLENVLKAVDVQLDAMTPINPELVAEATAKWKERGVDFSSVLVTIPE
ncbi:hypothetical protein [Burkholderia sp. LMU1-1-1.1]|uniref:hypothetical protein n=1 Tax=Burkholderia sp. LMU1-1-1.1 TaxID=3135266 RepID=UPI00342DF74C